MRLLIAEDERDLAEALSVFFEKNQFTVDTVSNGFDAYEYAVTGDYDAIVLDVMMPKLSGVEVLERLRAEGVRTPVMMLTAKAEKDDRITGFNAGADDYLPKPFAPDELICRVRAMLRRGGEYRPTVLTFGDAALDCSTGMLSCAGQSVRLSGREFRVSGHGAVPARAEGRALGRAHSRARLGLGQRRGDQRRLGAHLESAQEAQGHRLVRDHPRQPRAGLCTGGRR